MTTTTTTTTILFFARYIEYSTANELLRIVKPNERGFEAQLCQQG